MEEDDILRMLGQIVEENMRLEILKPRQSRGYDGIPKKTSTLSNRVYSGRLLDGLSVDWEVQPDGNVRMVFEFPQDTPEWYFVNYGRRGKKQNPALKYPPLSIIATWTKKKPLPQFRDRRGRFITNKQRNFLVQRSIGELGFQGIDYIGKAIQKSMLDIERTFGIYGRAYFERIIEERLIIRSKRQQ